MYTFFFISFGFSYNDLSIADHFEVSSLRPFGEQFKFYDTDNIRARIGLGYSAFQMLTKHTLARDKRFTAITVFSKE